MKNTLTITCLSLIFMLSFSTQAQFTQGFETEIPSGWTVINNGDANGWEQQTDPDGGAQEGTGVASILYSSDAHDDYLITPQITVTNGVNERFSYYIKSSSSFFLEPYEVLLSTTDATVGSFTTVLQSSIDAPNSFTQDVFDLSSYDGQSVYIAIHATGTNQFELFVDNVVNDAFPSCPEPQNLAVSFVSPASVDLTWDEEDVASATDGYEVVVMASGDAPDVNNAAATETVGNGVFTANVTSIVSDTDYDAYVRSVCDAANNEVSDWSSVASFTTACTPVSAPSWNEDFENAGSIPICWRQGLSNQKNWEFANEGGTNHIGNDGTIGGNTASDGYFAWLDDSSPHEIGTSLLSPFIDISNVGIPQVNFYLLSNNEGNTNVDFSLDVYDGGSYNEDVFFSSSNTANGEWELIEVPLTSLNITGDVIQLRFSVDENNGGDFYDDVAIDDVTVVEAPSCVKPIGLTASNVEATSANLNWNGESAASDGYDYVLITDGSTPDDTTDPDGSVSDVTTTTVTLTGLMSNTDYDAYVRSVCDAANNEVSDWSSAASFSTPCGVFTPDYTQDFTDMSFNETPDCWEEADDGDPSAGPTGFGSGDWTADGFLNDGTTGAAKVNLYNTGTSSWLLSPEFDLSGGGYEVVFDIGITAFSGTDDIPMGSDDEVQFLYSDDGGATWNNLQTWAAGSEPSNAGETLNYDLSSIIGTNVEFAFWATEGTVNDTEDYNIYIDNFKIRTPPTCPEPLNLTVSNITDTSADLNWDEEDPSSATDGYEWVVMASGDAPDTAAAVETGSVANGMFMATVNNLNAETDYDAYVRSVCDAANDEVSVWSAVESFSTGITPTVVSVGTPSIETYCYDNDEFKEWRFDSDNGSPLSVVFSAGSVEESFSGTFDDLIIYDGTDDAGAVLFDSNADGAELEGLSFTAASGSMYVTLDSDGSNSCQDPGTSNVDGPIEFGVYIQGNEPTTNVQIIHNSADPAASSVDIYLDGALLPELTGVSFRQASAFLEAPAFVDVTVDVVPAGADLSASVYTETFNLAEDEDYIIVADGVIDPSQFDGQVNTIDFSLEVFAGAQQSSTNAGETSVLVHHGSTDAPTVDVVNNADQSVLVDNISYTEFDGYLDLPTQDNYILNVTNATDNSSIVQSYKADLLDLSLTASAVTVVASGFLDPASNPNGAAVFGLWVALPAGGNLVPLPEATVGTDAFTANNFNFYPNPVEQRLNINSNGIVEGVQIFNMLGQEVIHVEPNEENPQINMSGLQSGAYMMKVSIDGASQSFRVIKK